MLSVLEEVMRIIAAAESKDDKCTSWQIRVQLATSILDLILIDTEVPCRCLPSLHLKCTDWFPYILHAAYSNMPLSDLPYLTAQVQI